MMWDVGNGGIQRMIGFGEPDYTYVFCPLVHIPTFLREHLDWIKTTGEKDYDKERTDKKLPDRR